MSGHTPGPWHYDSNVMVIYGVKRYGGDGEIGRGTLYHGADGNSFYEIGTIKRHGTWDYWKDDEHYVVPQDVKDRLRERDNANAMLVAAAPELLEALLDCVLYMENDDNNWSDKSPEYLKAKAAIDKATSLPKRVWV